MDRADASFQVLRCASCCGGRGLFGGTRDSAGSCPTVVDVVVRVSDGERDRVKSYMSEVCALGELTGTHQHHLRHEEKTDVHNAR